MVFNTIDLYSIKSHGILNDRTSALDLPSLTPLSLAGSGRLQLGTAHLVTSVSLLEVVDNYS